MIPYIHIITIIVFIILSKFGLAQNEPKTTSEGVMNKFLRAKEYQKQNKIKEAIEELELALIMDPKFVEGWTLVGDLYISADKFDKAKNAFKKAIEINPEYSALNFFNLGLIHYNSGEYEDAEKNFTLFLKSPTLKESQKSKGEYFLACSRFSAQAVKNPVPFNPLNMGDSINSEFEEYLPAITADEQTFIITRRIPVEFPTPGLSKVQEDFFISRKSNGKWTRAANLGKPINTPKNEGAQTISPDGRYIVFTACNRDDGKGSCDLYISRRNGDKWETPVNMGDVVNSAEWDAQPSFSSDGKTIYFASSRKGGLGGMDIWKTTMNEQGYWTPPVNLGKPINTAKNEISPFIHPDNQTLYFSSDGHVGLGGLDIYYSRKKEDGSWNIPENIGYPINTTNDESSLIVNASGTKAYFASDKQKDSKKYDIYEFEIPEKARPVPVTYMKGKVFNKTTLAPVEAELELIDLISGQTAVKTTSDKNSGMFLVCLPYGRNYALNVSKDGYLFYSETFLLQEKSEKSDVYIKDVPLIELKAGEKIVLKNVFFDSDKYDLKPESKVELEKVVVLMNKYPKLNIEISGHTDDRNTDEYNLKLSENRAKSVVSYLISKGINAERLKYKGYGERNPIADNGTEEGRALNRRTEMKVISN